jgi:type IV pilus assembly protein PilA
MRNRKGFTLIELMVVILIVGILAAVAVPIMRGRIDAAKWSEANASAGSVRTAVRAYIAEKGPTWDYTNILGDLGTVGATLSFSATDLDGAYFNQEDYAITSVDSTAGTCVVTIARSTKTGGPTGSAVLADDGTWTVTP